MFRFALRGREKLGTGTAVIAKAAEADLRNFLLETVFPGVTIFVSELLVVIPIYNKHPFVFLIIADVYGKGPYFSVNVKQSYNIFAKKSPE